MGEETEAQRDLPMVTRSASGEPGSKPDLPLPILLAEAFSTRFQKGRTWTLGVPISLALAW